jgi:preprotein translocase subunit YajC
LPTLRLIEISMTTTAIFAYLLIISYFVIERWLRKGEKALSLQAGEFDRGSSKIIWISGLLGIFLIFLAVILNIYENQFHKYLNLDRNRRRTCDRKLYYSVNYFAHRYIISCLSHSNRGRNAEKYLWRRI